MPGCLDKADLIVYSLLQNMRILLAYFVQNWRKFMQLLLTIIQYNSNMLFIVDIELEKDKSCKYEN